MTHDEMMSLLANTLADAAGHAGCLPILDCFSPHPGEEVTVSIPMCDDTVDIVLEDLGFPHEWEELLENSGADTMGDLVDYLCYCSQNNCYMLDQADRHPGAEHGTAKWGSAHRLNIKYRNTKDSKENYILTENVRFSTDSHAHKHNLNIIVIGGSGSGKTRFYVKPNALQLIGSYLFLDPKGELTRTLGRIMETKGISVTVLDLSLIHI